MPGIILYGPPASGKDTVTIALEQLDARCLLFQRLKVGLGKTSTYRMTDAVHLNLLRARGDIVWENHRYGATYAIDTPALRAQLDQRIPIVHLGQVDAVKALCTAIPGPWVVVALWCDRPTAARRLTERNPRDVAERLRVWDGTPPLPQADVTIDTGTQSPQDAARTVLNCLEATSRP